MGGEDEWSFALPDHWATRPDMESFKSPLAK